MADLSLARASRHAIEPEDVFARRDMQDVAGLAGKQQMFRHGRQGASEETAWRRPASAAWHVATHSNGPPFRKVAIDLPVGEMDRTPEQMSAIAASSDGVGAPVS